MLGTIVWITGRPASGKTTVAQGLLDAAKARGLATLWLDSDDLRPYLGLGPRYDDEGRAAFYRALAHVATLGARGGALVVISATGNRRHYRDALREMWPDFVEVHLDCPTMLAQVRDPKGLYAQAAAGDITTLPGVGLPYEAPERAELTLDAALPTAAQVDALMRVLDSRGEAGAS